MINFSGFIWGPSLNYYEDILNIINNNHTIFHFYKYKFDNKNDFEKSILDIYTTDDIDQTK